VKAIWVTRFDYKTPQDVVRIMDNCHKAGFNTVLFQVRGNATAFYPSRIEPWDSSFGSKNPGFDPLGVASREARRRGLSLQAWVNVMPAWRGTKPPADPNQLYNKRPEWFWYDQTGKRQELTSFYVSVNPCLPEVRKYLVDVFHDIVSRYDIDGLHMDYIRFPDEPPAIPKGSGIDYPRDARTLELYRKATGKHPDDDVELWKRWRAEQVTQLVADIRAMMRRTAPRDLLTASVAARSITGGGLAHFQDSRTWIARGLLDQVYVMNYTADPKVYAERLAPWLPHDGKAQLVPGLWFDGKVPAEEGSHAVREEIRIAREATGDFCVFAYSSLFDSRDEDLTRQTSEENRKRQIRRELVIPVIHGGGQRRPTS
jgi:uncharacterized lipoprotein YddW (UPF0748 family)